MKLEARRELQFTEALRAKPGARHLQASVPGVSLKALISPWGGFYCHHLQSWTLRHGVEE